MVSTRAKGNRSVRHAIKYYESLGYLVDKAEKTGKFIFEKDLFGLFDLVAIKRNEVVFIQVKTNRPPRRKDYLLFAKQYGGLAVRTEAYTWYDRKGPVVHMYYPNQKVRKIDLRKK